MMAAQIYVGPTVQGLNQNAVYATGLPASLQPIVDASADIKLLLVPLEKAAAALAAIKKAGTPEYAAFTRLKGAAPTPGADQPDPNTPTTGPIDVTLQDGVTAASAEKSFTATKDSVITLVVTGTSTSRTIKFEIAPPGSASFIPHAALSVSELGKKDTGTTGGTDTVPEGWRVSVPVGWTFRASITAVTGGNVTVKGKVVTS